MFPSGPIENGRFYCYKHGVPSEIKECICVREACEKSVRRNGREVGCNTDHFFRDDSGNVGLIRCGARVRVRRIRTPNLPAFWRALAEHLGIYESYGIEVLGIDKAACRHEEMRKIEKRWKERRKLLSGK